jgi:hypothetical protein
VRLRLPRLEDVCLEEVGLLFESPTASPWSGVAYLGELAWGGAPEFGIRFERWPREFDAAAGFTYLRGIWEIEEVEYSGSGCGWAESYTGDVGWRDYELEAQLTPVLGERHLLLFRVQGAMRCYGVGLAPGGRVALWKNASGYRECAGAGFPWAPGHAVTLHVECRGSEFAVSAGGRPLFTWRDPEHPWLHGMLGFATHNGHCHFNHLSVRGLAAVEEV